MDTGLLALIGIGIVVLIIAMNAFKYWTRRKLRAINTERKITVTGEAVAEFGRSVVLSADAATATALIESIPKNKLVSLRPGVWGLKYVERDDVVLELRDVDGGSELLVTSMREYWDSPQELPKWTNLVERVGQAAEAAGVTTRRGAYGFAFEPPSKGTNGHGRWVLAA
ncbi:hypothetical protein QCD70_09610 [Agreia sp. PsM10]|uniref:hypothetical protein n=1 Tax=Agreia sp. PsM10 TaxID=3030533 RepID=UPI00263B89D3|nr:hypothetical protein [Agreia sp. PsM10]MDN4640499.1 hypothetical protein [Agreia sp. PsM10]